MDVFKLNLKEYRKESHEESIDFTYRNSIEEGNVIRLTFPEHIRQFERLLKEAGYKEAFKK